MAVLIFLAAALGCLVAAFFFQAAPTEHELEENERLKEILWLPSIVIMVFAAFHTLRRLHNGPPPRLSAFTVLIFASLGFIILGGVALVGFGAKPSLAPTPVIRP